MIREWRDPHRFDDLFGALGPIILRRFFGGEGICSGDIMFGMIFGERIYFKTNDETRRAFLAEKCEPFAFEKDGKAIVTGWYAVPDRLYDDPEELAHWARAALDVTARSETAQRKGRSQAGKATAHSSLRTRSRVLRAARRRRSR